jgi:hypothetical protein
MSTCDNCANETVHRLCKTCSDEDAEAIRSQAFKEAAEAVKKMYPAESAEDSYSEGQSSYVNAVTTALQIILALAKKKEGES